VEYKELFRTHMKLLGAAGYQLPRSEQLKREQFKVESRLV